MILTSHANADYLLIGVLPSTPEACPGRPHPSANGSYLCFMMFTHIVSAGGKDCHSVCSQNSQVFYSLTGEMIQRLAALTVVTEDLRSVPSTPMASHHHL